MFPYQRPEKDSGDSSLESSMDTTTSVTQQTQNLYHRTRILEFSSQSLDEDKDYTSKIYDKVHTLLLVVHTKTRHSKMTQHIIETSIECLDNFSAEEASKAFIKLETFARNLINQPWKVGYRRIKIYSGFLKLHIDRYLKGTKVVFDALGYRKDNDVLVLEKKVGQRDKETVALDCYIAHVEMQVMKELFTKVSVLGYSYMDVYRSRQHCIDLSSCENWIFKHCKPKPRVPVETDYTGASNYVSLPPEISKEAQVSHPPKLSSRQDEGLDIYSPPQTRDRQSFVSIDGALKKNERSKSATEGSDKIGYATGTFDDHMKESMRILNEDKASPGVAPPSYEASSMYPNDKSSEDEWQDVREKIKNMGSQFADPGGRGDILGTGKANQGLPVKQPATSKTQIPSINPRPPIRDSACKPKQRTKQFGRTDLVADGDPESPNRSPTEGVKVSSTGENLIASIHNSTPYPAVRPRQPEFSTFRTTDIDSQNPQYVTKLAVPTAKPKHFTNSQKGFNETDSGDNGDYVSLRETITTTADLKHGKPSFQDNFQKTTARFYQHDASLHSLPILDGKKKKKIDENNILKTTPARSVSIWECEKCTYANKGRVEQCEMCGTSRVKGAEQMPLRSGGAQCQSCTLVNTPGSRLCVACGGTLKGSPTYI